MKRIAVLVSGGGSNLQALLDAAKDGDLPNGEICLVLASRADAFALTRAENANVLGMVRSPKDYPTREAYTEVLIRELQAMNIDLVVLAGFLFVLSPSFCEVFEHRIINVHPSLIPAFCGDGFYGLHVHERALKAGVKVTGATVHFVTAETDAGPIILQKAIDIEPNDTPETLQRRVMEQCEWKLLPRAVSLFCDGKLKVKDGIVQIEE